MKVIYKKNKGFTLVELLVVIAIIAVLAGIATPAILSGLKKAKITKAVSICSAFENAVENFEREYNYLPYGGGGNSPTTDEELRSDAAGGLVAVLAGADDDLNFKKIKFFDTDEATANRDGMDVDFTAGTATLYDPWGETYFIIVDYDLDDRVEDPFDEDAEIARSVVIYSLGPDMEGGDTGQNRDNAQNY